jgi:hypothetical protein
MKFSDLDFSEVFDGVWACASLLHVKTNEIDDILVKIIESLKSGGILYMSFKHGTFSGIRNGRYFAYYNTKSLKELIGRHKELEIIELWKSPDVRSDREEELWLNVIVKKIQDENQE